MSQGSSNPNPELESRLFRMKKEDIGNSYLEHLMKQYALYVEMMDKICSRRSSANTFFLSVNTFLITATGIVSKLGSSLIGFNALWMVVISLAGIFLCWFWTDMIQSYRRLSEAKFEVILAIEKKLPVAMYDAEWSYLMKDNKSKRYMELTKVERRVPWVFALLYVALMVIGLFFVISGYLWK